MPDQLSIQDFAGKVKSRFPQFAGMDDADLTRKILERRPELINQIQTSEKRPPLQRGKDEDSYLSQGVQGLKNVGKNLTVGMYEQSKVRAGEGVPPEAVGVPMPGAFIKNSIDDVLDGLQKGYEARQQARQQGEGIPGQILATAEQYPMVGTLVQKVEQSLTPKDLESAKSGPVLTPGGFGAVTEGIGYAAAPEALKKTGGALVKGAAKVIEKGPDLVRRGAQIIAGTTPERTTVPLVDEFKAKATDAATKQVEEVANTDAANRGAAEKYQTAKRNVLQESEAQKAEHTLKTEEVQQANAKEQARVDALNQAAQEQGTRRGELAQQLKDGSQKLGEGISELEKKVRETEVNPRYEAVRRAVANDHGVPLADLAKEASHAEQNILKGSKESIKQFRELIRGAPESQGIETSAGFTKPGEPLYEQLSAEGAIDQGGSLPFDQLQGYYSELGSKLSSGNLPGDMYQALKYVQGKIGEAMQKIADRNGAGPQLTEAQKYYRDFMDTFHEKPSAVAATRERVGKLDPEYYSDPFVSGKAGQTGIGKLKKYSSELADLATSLRKSDAEFSSLPKTVKVETPKLKSEPEPLAPVEQPQKPEFKAPKTIEQPTTPTTEDVRARKTEEIQRSAKEIGHLSKYDAGVIASSAIGPFFGHWSTLLIDPAFVVARKAIGRTLERPAVVKWLSEPTPADLEILRKVPDRVRSDVQNNIKDFITEERAAGRPVKLAGAVSKFLTGGAAESAKKKPGDLKNQGAALAGTNQKKPEGLLEQGNINLNGRPILHNPDGTISSEVSFSRGTDKGEVLVPLIVNGKKLTQDQAWRHYLQTGEHMGIFDTPEHADAYAEKAHSRKLSTSKEPLYVAQ